MNRRMFLGLLAVISIDSRGICSQPNPDFSGTWKLSGERSTPARASNVTLHIDHRDPDLTVETDALRGSGTPRHAAQSYTTDGKVSVSTGADGDEFHTAIVWEGQSLVFSVEEHEDGRVIWSKERWRLIENGTALERVREGAPGGKGSQTLIYLREAQKAARD